MTDNTIRVRAEIEDAIDNANHDDRDQPIQEDQDVVVPVPPAAPGAAQDTGIFRAERQG